VSFHVIRRVPAAFAMFVAAAAVVLSPTNVVAQQWKCLAPSDCGPLIPNGNMVTFALRLEHTPDMVAPGVKTRIRLSDGVLFVDGHRVAPAADGWIDVRTDALGVVSGYVQGAKAGQEIPVTAEVRPGEFVTQTLRVVTPVVLRRATPDFVRYAGTQSWDVSVSANGLDEQTCKRSVVRFTPRGGTGAVSLDSAYGDFSDGRTCVYSTDWRLGPEVGRQVLLARAGSAPPVEINAIARRRPSLRVGLGMALRRGEISTRHNPRAGEKIRVRHLTPDGYIEFDSVPGRDSVITSDPWRPEAMPLILLDGPAPFFLKRTNLRLSVGASATNVQRDFFVGAAIQQLRFGVQSEDNGFDLQFGALFSRPERLTNPALCLRDLQADRPKAELVVSCDTRDNLRFDGVVGTVSTDAQSLIGAVGKMLGFG
jgi:hypothetical protein